MPRKALPEKKQTDGAGEEPRAVSSDVMSNEFIALDDLVYAPLHALAESNLRLHGHVVETVRKMGVVRQRGTDEVIQLDNIKIAYDQIHADGDDGYSIDNMQLEVPLLSIIPVTNMSVEKAEIAFSAEIRAVTEKDGVRRVNARISSPEQRESDFLPRVSYKMSVSSLPATEGFLRISDMMSANQLAKKTDTTPVSMNGVVSDDDQKDGWRRISLLKTNIKRLNQLYQKVTDILTEQQRLRQISDEAFADDTFDIDEPRYRRIQSDITNRIMEYQERILDLEVRHGMGSLEEIDDEDGGEK